MADTARKTLNIATKTKGMNYNVQLYAKILLENQTNKQVTKHSTRHLTVNEVCYETSTESDYIFMFATFPSNLNVQTIHQSQVQHNEVEQINFDSITVKLSCTDAKYTFSIPTRMRNRFFEQRMNDLAKFLKEEVESVPRNDFSSEDDFSNSPGRPLDRKQSLRRESVYDPGDTSDGIPPINQSKMSENRKMSIKGNLERRNTYTARMFPESVTGQSTSSHQGASSNSMSGPPTWTQLIVQNDDQIEKVVQELLRQAPPSRPLTVNIFKNLESIDSRAAELRLLTEKLEKLPDIAGRTELKEKLLELVQTFP